MGKITSRGAIVVSVVTIADVKLALFLPEPATPAIDARVTMVTAQATDRIARHLADTPDSWDPAWTPATAPARVQRAVIYLAGHYYKNVDGAPSGTDDADVWAAITRLLVTDRDPVVA